MAFEMNYLNIFKMFRFDEFMDLTVARNSMLNAIYSQRRSEYLKLVQSLRKGSNSLYIHPWFINNSGGQTFMYYCPYMAYMHDISKKN